MPLRKMLQNEAIHSIDGFLKPGAKLYHAVYNLTKTDGTIIVTLNISPEYDDSILKVNGEVKCYDGSKTWNMPKKLIDMIYDSPGNEEW
jgi:hypothetical protein